MSARFEYHMIADRTLSVLPLQQLAREVNDSGIHYFQLREKDLPPAELLFLAKEIRKNLTRVKFIVNGSLDVALAANADGVHLQKANIPVASVRARYADLMIGYSAHSISEMEQASREGADYVFVSPIFDPISKQSGAVPLGISQLASWTKQMTIPVFALGGITKENLKDVQASGCSGAAGISLFLKEGHLCFGLPLDRADMD